MLSYLSPMRPQNTPSFLRADKILDTTGLILFVGMAFMLVWYRWIAEVCMALIGILFLVRSAAYRDWSWARQPFFLLMLLTWAWVNFVISPLSPESASSFSRSIIWIRYPLLMAAVTYWIIRSEQTAYQICTILSVLIAYICIDTVFQYLTGASFEGTPILGDGSRLTGPFGNVKVGNYLGKIALPVLGYLLWRAADKRQRGAIAGFALGLGSVFVVVLLSGERAAFVTLALALSYIICHICWYYPHLRMHLAGLLLALAAIVAVLVITQPALQDRAQMLYDHITQFSNSPYGNVMHTSLLMLSEHWPFGIGMDNYQNACQQFMQAHNLPNYCERHAHNPYLEWFTETGLMGLLLFSALAVCMVLAALQPRARTVRHAELLVAISVAICLLHFFPVVSTSSSVSNWSGMLFWYSLSLMAGCCMSAGQTGAAKNGSAVA